MRVPEAWRWVALLLGLMFGLMLVLPSQAAPAGAATGLSFGRDACQADGTVAGRLSWTPSGLGNQYVDLGLDAGFARFSTGGPYASTQSVADLTRLTPGATYYVRVRTEASNQSLASDVLTISVQGCAGAAGLQASARTVSIGSEYSGKCLEIYGFSQANFATANQWGCWGGANQRVQLSPLADGYFELRMVHSGKCLEVLNWSTANGAPIGQYACHGGNNQRWAGSFDGGTSMLRNKFSQKCLDVSGWGRADGTPIVQWDCHAGANQQWRTGSSASPPASPPSGPVIAITIDTDSIRAYMPQMLDILDAYGVKASIALTGQWAVANPDLVQRIASSGHTLMNHSWNHPAFTAISTAERHEQLRLTDEAIQRIAGASTRPYFRPPFGINDASIRADVAAAGYRVVLWNVDPQGWRGYSGETITSHILTHAFNGAVVLMHSTAAGDLAALGPTIAALQARGYRFVTISQLLPP